MFIEKLIILILSRNKEWDEIASTYSEEFAKSGDDIIGQQFDPSVLPFHIVTVYNTDFLKVTGKKMKEKVYLRHIEIFTLKTPHTGSFDLRNNYDYDI